MRDFKAAVPLSFALALSAAAPNAVTAAATDPAEWLRPGSLQNLVESAESVSGDSASAVRDNSGVRRRIAQACWSGYWRRC